jgi:hypothetical protein
MLFSFLPLPVLLLSLSYMQVAVSKRGTASLTHYISYAPCCPENENYDPTWPTAECELYSACRYAGLFWALDGVQSVEFVQSHSLVAFFDRSDASNSQFDANYANKNVTLVLGDTIVFQAEIVDACGDSDCGGCCSANSAETGYLVDLEYYTALRFLGDVALATGTIDFYIDEEYVPPPSPAPSSTPTSLQCKGNSNEFTVDSSW